MRIVTVLFFSALFSLNAFAADCSRYRIAGNEVKFVKKVKVKGKWRKKKIYQTYVFGCLRNADEMDKPCVSVSILKKDGNQCSPDPSYAKFSGLLVQDEKRVKQYAELVEQNLKGVLDMFALGHPFWLAVNGAWWMAPIDLLLLPASSVIGGIGAFVRIGVRKKIKRMLTTVRDKKPVVIKLKHKDAYFQPLSEAFPATSETDSYHQNIVITID